MGPGEGEDADGGVVEAGGEVGGGGGGGRGCGSGAGGFGGGAEAGREGGAAAAAEGLLNHGFFFNCNLERGEGRGDGW